MSAERLRQAAAKIQEAPMAARRPWVREDKIAMATGDLLHAIDRAARLAGAAADHPEATSIRAEADALADLILGETQP